ncbi:peptidylprolyl isomerase [Hyphococcus flavus]|uniref:Peptidyl-prolyl cis-trans isomerase n=1 Tax=Hyphococcus flavus TaxID=1866326 RepID=A0AAF0CIU4_9PROT|nr:peptidylprolyl isomerase [Hyphococcus flavus]WDI33222.1 peptidylprolyl isomerase [Hyphococcus flavus]
MVFRMLVGFVTVVFALAASVGAQETTHAKIQTSMGDIVVELYPGDAPITVQNFLEYATSGHYDRTLFHRVVARYVIQGGGYSRYYTERPPRDPIAYEGDNGLENKRGTLAMARSDDPASAQAQWFINLADNERFDHKIVEGMPLYGYAVFARVVDGMDVVDAIGSVSTGPGGPFESEAPIDPVIIERVDPVDWPITD